MTIYMSYLYERNDSRYYKQKNYERKKVTQLGLQAIKKAAGPAYTQRALTRP